MITIDKLNKLKLNTEVYIQKKHNNHLYKYNIKYPINYGRHRYYIRLEDKILKLKKSKGISYLYNLVDSEIDNVEEFKLRFLQSKAFVETLKVLYEIIPKFSSVSVPKDLLNPTIDKAEKLFDPSIKLSIHWFKSDLEGEPMDPSVFNLVIFDV
nr:MAG TPA: hypothetical protein [Bacteriophage sp.]